MNRIMKIITSVWIAIGILILFLALALGIQILLLLLPGVWTVPIIGLVTVTSGITYVVYQVKYGDNK